MREPSFILQILGMILVIGFLGNYAIKTGIEAQRKQDKKKNK
tara:strand:+ start:354 stop:479 length:126 start_codon:yes stop_codon:yes gene_type:complete